MVEDKMVSKQRELAAFQHIMLENDICTETHSLTLNVLGMLKTCRTPDSRRPHLDTLLSLTLPNNHEEHVRPKGYVKNSMPLCTLCQTSSPIFD